MPSDSESSTHTSPSSPTRTSSLSPVSPTSPTTPSTPSAPKTSKATPKTLALSPNHASQTTTALTRLTTLLSRTSTLDTTLLTATYTLTLLHSLLSLLTRPHNPTSRRLRLHRLLTTIPPLTSLLSSLRIHLRLWALLPIYLSALHTYHHPPSTAPARLLTWAQILASAVYQACENAAFLAEKGVLGWRMENVRRVWRWSARAWAVWVGLELGRLVGVGWGMRREEERRRKEWEEGKEGEKGQMVLSEKGKEERTEVEVLKREIRIEEDRWKEWWREVGINAAYAPMTVHYSLQNGLLGEGSLGALGMVVAWLSFGKVWRESA